MQPYSEVLLRVIDDATNNRKPRQGDIDELRLITDDVDRVRYTMGAMIGGDGKIAASFLNLPISVIHFEILEVAKASITITLPSQFNNLLIFGSGSVDVANGGNIWAQINDDTGASNYSWHLIEGDGVSVSAMEDTSFHAAALGVFGTTGAGAGVNGSFEARIPNYTSNVWKKNVISQIYTAEFNAQYVTGSTWHNAAPMNKIEIFGTNNTLVKGTANLAEGCRFTVIGIL